MFEPISTITVIDVSYVTEIATNWDKEEEVELQKNIYLNRTSILSIPESLYFSEITYRNWIELAYY